VCFDILLKSGSGQNQKIKKKIKNIPLFVLNFMHSYFANITQPVYTHI